MAPTVLLFAVLSVAVADAPASDFSVADGGARIYEFYSEDCIYCRQMQPGLDVLRKQGYPIVRIDVNTPEGYDYVDRYGVEDTPTFLIVDAESDEIARRVGKQPYEKIADLYDEILDRTRTGRSAVRDGAERRGDTQLVSNSDRKSRARPATKPPFPWETVVRINVNTGREKGVGSGTIISSTPTESLILTCAHIFQDSGRRRLTPDEFRRRGYLVEVELFDGKIRRYRDRDQVRPTAERFRAEVIDFNVDDDVGLIKIRPRRRLPASPLLPSNVTLVAGMRVHTTGCSQGRDATAWTTEIVAPVIQRQFRYKQGIYKAIECREAPIQGRSGGGLFTDDGYLVGVCNFASPGTNTGWYAHPTSIRRLIGENRNHPEMLAFRSSPSRGRDVQVAVSDRRRANEYEVEIRTQGPPKSPSRRPGSDDDPRAIASSRSTMPPMPSHTQLGLPEPSELEGLFRPLPGRTSSLSDEAEPLPLSPPTGRSSNAGTDRRVTRRKPSGGSMTQQWVPSTRPRF